jgi:hypothetical protein
VSDVPENSESMNNLAASVGSPRVRPISEPTALLERHDDRKRRQEKKRTTMEK